MSGVRRPRLPTIWVWPPLPLPIHASSRCCHGAVCRTQQRRQSRALAPSGRSFSTSAVRMMPKGIKKPSIFEQLFPEKRIERSEKEFEEIWAATHEDDELARNAIHAPYESIRERAKRQGPGAEEHDLSEPPEDTPGQKWAREKAESKAVAQAIARAARKKKKPWEKDEDDEYDPEKEGGYLEDEDELIGTGYATEADRRQVAVEKTPYAATVLAGMAAQAPVLIGEPDEKMRQPPTVLVLSGATTSLLPSDFFRIAPQLAESSSSNTSQQKGHVTGWTASGGGLYKVVQDRDPETLEARGRYYLYFGAPAAALAYAQEVRDLHTLARQALYPRPQRKEKNKKTTQPRFQQSGDWGDAVFRRGRTWDPAGATEEEAAALRNFTLVAPTQRLVLAMEMPDEKATLDEAEEEAEEGAAATPTAKVLLALDDLDHTYEEGAPFVTDDNRIVPPSGTTIEGVRRLLARDGYRRNLPWAVASGINDVVPVPWVVAERKARLRARLRRGKRAVHDGAVPDLHYKSASMNPRVPFSRFVVSFVDTVEARRFVRSWHRRTVKLPSMSMAARMGGQLQEIVSPGRSVVVEASLLW